MIKGLKKRQRQRQREAQRQAQAQRQRKITHKLLLLAVAALTLHLSTFKEAQVTVPLGRRAVRSHPCNLFQALKHTSRMSVDARSQLATLFKCVRFTDSDWVLAPGGWPTALSVLNEQMISVAFGAAGSGGGCRWGKGFGFAGGRVPLADTGYLVKVVWAVLVAFGVAQRPAFWKHPL